MYSIDQILEIYKKCKEKQTFKHIHTHTHTQSQAITPKCKDSRNYQVNHPPSSWTMSAKSAHGPYNTVSASERLCFVCMYVVRANSSEGLHIISVRK